MLFAVPLCVLYSVGVFVGLGSDAFWRVGNPPQVGNLYYDGRG